MTYIDIDEILGESQRIASKENGGQNNKAYAEKYVQMPEGKGSVVVRILPPAAKGKFGRDKNPFFLVAKYHKINNKNIFCFNEWDKSSQRWVGDCPICQQYTNIWKKINKEPPNKEELVRLARSLKGIVRYYYQAIVRSEKDKDTGEIKKNVGPKILSVGEKIHKKIITAFTGDKEMNEEPLGDITDFKNGRDFKIMKNSVKGTDGQDYPDYSQSRFEAPTPAGSPDEIAHWLETMHDLYLERQLKAREEVIMDLKIHLGLEKDPSQTFDLLSGNAPRVSRPSESDSDEPASPPAPKAEKVNKPEIPAQIAEDVGASKDESIPEEDFVKKLREKLNK